MPLEWCTMLYIEIEIYMEAFVMLGLGDHEPQSWLAAAFPCFLLC